MDVTPTDVAPMDVAPGGYRYAAILAALAVPAFAISPPVAAVGVLLAVAAVLFHRDPERDVPDRGVVAPADGAIRVLREEDGRLRVGTFMNVDDVHVNRAPLGGTVTDVAHEPGGHWPAFTKESDRNERVLIDLETDVGPARVVMIAGAVARRIHPYVEPGDELGRGERIGHISFGSRVDVLLPPGVERAELAVERGDTVHAGETVLVSDVDALVADGGAAV